MCKGIQNKRADNREYKRSTGATQVLMIIFTEETVCVRYQVSFFPWFSFIHEWSKLWNRSYFDRFLSMHIDLLDLSPRKHFESTRLSPDARFFPLAQHKQM